MAPREVQQLIPKVGVRAEVCEAIYLKYMFGVVGMSRIVLWSWLSFLNVYPKQGCFDDPNPRGVRYGDPWIRTLVNNGIDHLYLHMCEICMDHVFHPNNQISHFPWFCIGPIDTFPIHAPRGQSRFQPKFYKNVVKFQDIVSHLDLLRFFSGPHPGAMSDTTPARIYRPPYALLGFANYYLLAEFAYLSVPHMLPPFKGDQTTYEEEFTRIHQFYRARAEKVFAGLLNFDIVASHYRGDRMKFLGCCIRVLCSVQIIDRAFRPQYVPYSPIPQDFEVSEPSCKRSVCGLHMQRVPNCCRFS